MRAPGPGEVLLESLSSPSTPRCRAWISENPGYVQRIDPGDTMRGSGIRARGGIARCRGWPRATSCTPAPAGRAIPRGTRRGGGEAAGRRHADRLAGRAGHDRPHRLFRHAFGWRGTAGRDGAGLRRRRRRRPDRRPGRCDRGLPCRRHRRRGGEMRLAARGTRLPRRHRLQGRTRPRGRDRARMPGRARRVLRQCRRRHAGCGAGQPEAARTGGDLRPHLANGGWRALWRAQHGPADRQARPGGGLHRHRLRPPFRRGPRVAGRPHGRRHPAPPRA